MLVITLQTTCRLTIARTVWCGLVPVTATGRLRILKIRVLVALVELKRHSCLQRLYVSVVDFALRNENFRDVAGLQP